MGRKYTPEMEEWISSNLNNYRNYQLLADAFNVTFNMSIKWKAFSHKVTRMGLVKKNYGSQIYTTEHRDWLKAHANDYRTLEDVTAAFNAHFDMNQTVHAIVHQSALMHLQKENYGRNAKGQHGNTNCPIGTEKIRRGKNGKPYKWVKVNDDIRTRGNDCGSYNHNWRAKHKLVWEETYGKIPEWGNIFFLDGNTLNCDINNLILVDNTVNGWMLANGWTSTDNVNLNKAKLRWCEHAAAVKKAERETRWT